MIFTNSVVYLVTITKNKYGKRTKVSETIYNGDFNRTQGKWQLPYSPLEDERGRVDAQCVISGVDNIDIETTLLRKNGVYYEITRVDDYANIFIEASHLYLKEVDYVVS